MAVRLAFVPPPPAPDRFQAWVEDGCFLRCWQAALAGYDACHGIRVHPLALPEG